MPWGNTKISVVPAAVNGAWRSIDVGDQGLLFHPVESVLPQPALEPEETLSVDVEVAE